MSLLSSATTVSVATTTTTTHSKTACSTSSSILLTLRSDSYTSSCKSSIDDNNSNHNDSLKEGDCQCYGRWLNWMNGHPLALMLLQYSTAASQAATLYIFSAVWTLSQSMAMMFTAQSLEWIQSLGPMVWLAWDSFLPGALFLTMNIDPDLLDGDHHPEAMIPLPSSSSKTASSRSSRSSSNSSNKKVTFDEQVMILGRSAALAQQIQQQQQHADRSYSVMIDPTQPLVESPTRTEFFDKHSILSMMRQEEAAYQQQHYYNTNKGYRSTGTNSTVSNASSDNMSLSDCGGSPASSRSNSCRSSICSIDSNESRETKKSTSSRIAALFHPHRHASTASRPSSPVGSSRHIHGSTLGDFAFNTQQKVSATALVPNTAAFADSLPSVIPTHHKHPLMHKIMHPHQHKRELLGQQQLQQQQQIGTPRSSQEEVWSLTDYEPRHKTKSKTLGERLGLKKNKKAL